MEKKFWFSYSYKLNTIIIKPVGGKVVKKDLVKMNAVVNKFGHANLYDSYGIIFGCFVRDEAEAAYKALINLKLEKNYKIFRITERQFADMETDYIKKKTTVNITKLQQDRAAVIG